MLAPSGGWVLVFATGGGRGGIRLGGIATDLKEC